MKSHGRTSIHEFLEDRIVYRNLVPGDERLPSLAEIGPLIGLAPGVIPRKSQPDYARVIVELLQEARGVDLPGVNVQRLVFVGDTQLNDGTAFANICRAGGWPGLAFIGSDRDVPAEVEIVEQGVGALFVANRWSALTDFGEFCQDQGHVVDERTAVIVDLDKTALGARGRNDHVIDSARVEAVRQTVGDLLGEEFDSIAFQDAYDRLNQPEFHAFTSDNQDYLAYICLTLGSGLYELGPLVNEVRGGRLQTFRQFIDGVEMRAGELSADLRQIHGGIYAFVRQGDPTPFKDFRHNEYRTTVACMGYLTDSEPVHELLANEIVITQEVREAALLWRAQGALLFGLSDKPDEASVPSDDLAAEGYEPIHRVETHAVGSI
jgi:hypothetical protein